MKPSSKTADPAHFASLFTQYVQQVNSQYSLPKSVYAQLINIPKTQQRHER
ncbi:hypothetical protein [Spirosoma koreense]